MQFPPHLVYDKKSDKPNKNQEKALDKFKEFLDWKEDEDEQVSTEIEKR